MKTNLIVLVSALVLISCRNKNGEADAYGNFEATEVIVSSESGGRILKINVDEGTVIGKGEEIAQVDTTLICLQQSEIDASIGSVRTKLGSIDAQNGVLAQQIANLDVNIKRIENMLRDDAATKKQYDDLTGQADVIRKQMEANQVLKATTAAEINVLQARRATVNEQIARCRVRSPLQGTIIEKYAEAGEMTAAGKPLVKIADLSVMKLKVYISGAQLGSLKTGQECRVRADNGKKGYDQFSGTISYISGKAEFTPKIVQTKEERVTLVYAVTIDVKNDGTLKSGMPGEAIF